MKTGDSINGYKLLKSCGRGAFGEVFLAESFMGQKVALKIVKLEGKSADRELQALQDYIKCCPNEYLMSVLHADQKDDFFFYVMELADNLDQNCDNDDAYVADTLQTRLQKNGPLTVKETTDLAIQLLKGIMVLHSHDLIHRDIKPANILWIHGQAKLGDIGLVAHDNSMTCTAGTPGFMPPPNLGIRSNSPQVDLYALAQVLHCCLYGMRDTGFDGLELTDVLENNGQVLLNTIDLVSGPNSPIKTADQFLDALTKPAKRKKRSSQPKSRKKAQRKSRNVPSKTEPLQLEADIERAKDYHALESYHDDHSIADTILDVGMDTLPALIPGGRLAKGLTKGGLLLTKGLFKFLHRDSELEDLRYQKAYTERQLEDARLELEAAKRQMEAAERQKEEAERMNRGLSRKRKKEDPES